MPLSPKDIARLLVGHLSGELTEAEAQELKVWANQSRKHRAVTEELADEEQIRALANRRTADRQADIKNQLLEKIRLLITEDEAGGNASFREVQPVHRVHFLKMAWVRYAAAIVLVFGIAAYLWNTPQKEPPAITKTENSVRLQNDVPPGRNRALLTLSNGSTIVLDSASTGQIAREGGSVVKKAADGQVIYTPEKTTLPQPVVYNTMSTPRGGQYQVALPDGSRVWLNAESSITYPTVFSKTERNISITGEAYFEVKKNEKRPFTVRTPSDKITVLGTSFNVNAYSDEPASKTSLVEGSVRINDKILRPGQAYIEGKVVVTDIEQDVAWKNGVFAFSHADIKAVIRQLARWYDIEVEFEGVIPGDQFSGDIKRNLPLSKVLSVLANYGIRYTIEDRKVRIRQ